MKIFMSQRTGITDFVHSVKGPIDEARLAEQHNPAQAALCLFTLPL
jgi:hypothetical protein